MRGSDLICYQPKYKEPWTADCSSDCATLSASTHGKDSSTLNIVGLTPRPMRLAYSATDPFILGSTAALIIVHSMLNPYKHFNFLNII